MEPRGKGSVKEEVRTDPKKFTQPSRRHRFHTGPSAFRDPKAPPRPGGIVTTVEDHKGRNIVEFSTVPLPPKRTRGPNKPRPDPDLVLSDEEELGTGKSRWTFRGRKASRARLNKNPRGNSEPNNTSSIGKLRSAGEKENSRQDDGVPLYDPSLPATHPLITQRPKSKKSSKELTRRANISKAMLAKRGPEVKKAMSAADRKRKQRSQNIEKKKEEEKEKNAWRQRIFREEARK